jgi:Zn-finger nucleic acid-binding protein
LVLTAEGELNTWVCPAGHGLALTLSEAHVRLQEDEIAQLWQAARSARPAAAARPCPMCAQPMAAIEVTVDADEVGEQDTGDGPDLGSEWIDACESCQVLWFDAGELDGMPVDRADAEPSDRELAQLAEIRSRFGQQVVSAARDAQAAQLTERVYRRIARHPRVLDALEEVGSLGRA